MNNLLRDTLAERANSAEPPPLDLDAIITAGHHRITRRRATAVLGGAVLAAAAAVSGVTVTRSLDRQSEPARRPTPFSRRQVTFALGNTIHYGSQVLSAAPHRVSAFVQTDVGFVFLDEQNEIYRLDRSGVRRIAPRRSTWRLTGPASGSLVGWVENFGDHCESVVYDLVAERELVRTPLGNKIPPYASLAISPAITALDNEAAYLNTVEGLYRWDLKAGSGARVGTDRAANVIGVSAGQYLYRNPKRLRHADPGLLVGPEPGATGGRMFPANLGYLSPSATYLLAGTANNPEQDVQAAALDLYAVESGTKLPLRHPGHTRLIFSQWLDDTTFTAVGLRAGQGSPVDLLTCSAATLTSKVSVPAFASYTFDPTPPREAPFALPVGKQVLQPVS